MGSRSAISGTTEPPTLPFRSRLRAHHAVHVRGSTSPNGKWSPRIGRGRGNPGSWASTTLRSRRPELWPSTTLEMSEYATAPHPRPTQQLRVRSSGLRVPRCRCLRPPSSDSCRSRVDEQRYDSNRRSAQKNTSTTPSARHRHSLDRCCRAKCRRCQLHARSTRRLQRDCREAFWRPSPYRQIRHRRSAFRHVREASLLLHSGLPGRQQSRSERVVGFGCTKQAETASPRTSSMVSSTDSESNRSPNNSALPNSSASLTLRSRGTVAACRTGSVRAATHNSRAA